MSKLMRRIWSVLIAVAMCVTMLPLNAFALDGNANTMVATFDQISALVGETVKVNVTLKNNPGITSFKLAVKWDADFLTLEGIDYNSSLGGMSIPPASSKSPAYIQWVHGTQNVDLNDVFATLNFKVADDAPANAVATITADFDPDDICKIVSKDGKYDEENVPLTIVNGSVKAMVGIPGDINMDSKVNNKDCSVCNEVIEKQTVIPAKSESNVTVIGDESFAGSKKELADAVLSAEDIENINSGKDITIRLNVALKSDATDAIKEQVKAKLKDYTIGTFYDIDISKSIDGGAPVAVTDTNAPVHIQLTLADSLINTNAAVKRDYKIVRFHYDSVTGQTVVDILDASYHAGYNKLDFNTDKFSVYAVVYKDTEIVATTPTPAPTTKPDSANVDNNNNSNTNNSNSTVEKPSITGKVCPVCGYNNCKLGNDNRWHCGKCAHSWQEYGQAGSTSSTGNAPKSPKTGLF